MNKKTTTITISVSLAALLVVIIIVGVMAGGKKSSNLDSTNTKQTTQTTATSSTSYKNGTYSSNGSYNSPGGEETIKVVVTLKDNVITDATVTSLTGDFTSKEYQNDFINGYKTLVIGKKITAVHLTQVSGSSLTSKGFNSAIAKIEAEAS